MFITDRVLVLDFQKKYTDENQLKGEYHVKLSSHEISTAAYYATNLITCDNILWKKFFKQVLVEHKGVKVFLII